MEDLVPICRLEENMLYREYLEFTDTLENDTIYLKDFFCILVI
jgi:hypothetical protein